MTVTIFTDGGSLGNPGPGGYGAVILDGSTRKEISGGYKLTTNNRMEIMGAIKALEALLHPSDVVLHTDSRYLADAMTLGWAQRWKANGWKRNNKDQALNVDLWKILLELCKKHRVSFQWVKAHAGNPENERCDFLVKQAARGNSLSVDEGYRPGAGTQQAALF